MSKSIGRDIAEESEISLVDILCILRGSLKTIIFFGLIGIALSIAFLVNTPKRYEAVVQIAMMQISTTKNNPLGINIEEPALLVSRLTFPTSFTPEVLVACGLQDQENAALMLSKAIKLTIPKGVDNVVELKTYGVSRQLAQDCAQGLFDLIKHTQAIIMIPYIEETKIKLAYAQDRLQKERDLVARLGKSGMVMGESYISARDEIYFLLGEIVTLKHMLTSNQNRATRMIAPIYASEVPTAPNKKMTLMLGLFGGLFAGLLIVLARKMLLRHQSESDSVLRA